MSDLQRSKKRVFFYPKVYEGPPLGSPSKSIPQKCLNKIWTFSHKKLKITSSNPAPFLLTISPKGDIQDEAIRMITKYIQKQSDYRHIVIENGMNGKAHLHSIFLTPKHMDKQKMQQNIWSRFVKNPIAMLELLLLISSSRLLPVILR